MTSPEPHPDDVLARWCGWVLVVGLALTPLLAWLAPLGFAPLLATMGLLSLPALRLERADRPMIALLAAVTAWAALSTSWSPFTPSDPEGATAAKLALMLPLFWSAVCGARRASPSLSRTALAALAWGLAACGAVMLVEAFSGAAAYRAIRTATGDPTTFEYARKNVAHGGFVLALLWPLAAVAGWRAGAPRWLALPMALGVGVMAHVFLADAPVLSLAVVVLAGAAVWFAGRRGAWAVGGVYAAIVLAMPGLVAWLGRPLAAAELPLSWAQRVSYWIFAADRVNEAPLLGHGLDASRTYTPHLALHPHNGPLQAWLELGLPGALALAGFWLLAMRRLGGGRDRALVAGAAASAAVYLLFGLVNFGLWQEWFLALGAMLALIWAAVGRLRA